MQREHDDGAREEHAEQIIQASERERKGVGCVVVVGSRRAYYDENIETASIPLLYVPCYDGVSFCPVRGTMFNLDI